MDDKYLLDTVVDEIAFKWKDIGAELDIKNLDNYEDYDSPVEEEYKHMIRDWLGKAKGAPEDVLSCLCATLEKIQLNYDAGWLRGAAKQHLNCKIK